MGFKDLHLFNHALLASQAWRLLTVPNSLCARVMKAKYFPVGNLIDAFTRDASPCWRGIEHGLELLKKGTIWRIGNGQSVNIWRDNWIPTGNLKLSVSLSRSRLRGVSDLIARDIHAWNEECIRSICIPPDAEEILKIPLPQSDIPDQIAWHFETSGRFSVRSAYRLALQNHCNELSKGQISNSPDGGRPPLGTNLEFQSSVKGARFCLKLATDSLAVQQNRARRLPNQLPTCQICGSEPEDGYHAVMNCTRARALRTAMKDHWEVRAKLLLLWCRAWHHRNNIIFNHGNCPVSASITVLTGAISAPTPALEPDRLLKGKESADIPKPPSDCARSAPRPCWSRPKPGWLKLNVDASFISSSGQGAWGAIIRNHEGQPVGSAWAGGIKAPNAETMESIAVREGIRSMRQLLCRPVIIECDCQHLIKELTCTSPSRAAIFPLLADIAELLKGLPDYELLKIPRLANMAAHDLAAFARIGVSSGLRTGSVPESLRLDPVEPCNEFCCN
ncbi:hypothetical protein BRADI_3g34611v3 [Brachypodium distachyon]|uniref:RNase H type-1 domain-containing protein n=1 Tax=Brachypodium distachyon TaxID=15368 RepID=A0A2K2D139_BRADI|nr:hypothetical protein BRADI_3g34611v3 [Brachypodium distachyon]